MTSKDVNAADVTPKRGRALRYLLTEAGEKALSETDRKATE